MGYVRPRCGDALACAFCFPCMVMWVRSRAKRERGREKEREEERERGRVGGINTLKGVDHVYLKTKATILP